MYPVADTAAVVSPVTVSPPVRSLRPTVVLPGDQADRAPHEGMRLAETVAEVAHDLRNVLAAIMHQAELLHSEAHTPEVRRRLEVIQRSAESGGHMLQRLNRESRPADPPAEELVDLNRVLLDVAEITRFRWGRVAGDPRPVIDLNLDLQETPAIPGRSSELVQVFTNLVVNACESLVHGGTVHLSTRFDGNHTVAVVRDDGPGMDREVQARIFQRTFSTKGTGNQGLGLSIVSDLVTRHGGHIIMESSPGAGATFMVLLHPPAAPDTAPAADSQPPPRRIVVADDDPGIREGLVQLLLSAGHEVVAAASAAAAQEALKPGADLLLTDLRLGADDGRELARWARLAHPGLKVILLTGWDPEDAAAGVEVDLRLTKPVFPGVLLEAVTRLLG